MLRGVSVCVWRGAQARGDAGSAVPGAATRKMLCTAAVTGVSPSAILSMRCQVPGTSSRAAMTAATSARGDRADGGRRGGEPDPADGRSIGEAVQAQDGPVQVPAAQIGLGGGLRRDVGRPGLTGAGTRRAADSHRGGLMGAENPVTSVDLVLRPLR